MLYQVATLPPIDAVEIALIKAIEVDRVSEYMDHIRDVTVPRTTVGGLIGATITDLFRRLPPSEGSRCHVPTYGLLFFDGAVLVAEFSLCWRCNNGFGRAGETRAHVLFDGASSVAVELRELLARELPLA